MSDIDSSVFVVDSFNDNSSVIDDTSDRIDALGDIKDPESLTFDDFAAEWVWRDSGLTKTPWFFKSVHKDNGRGIDKLSSDVASTLIDTQAVCELELIKRHGVEFVARINKLIRSGISGNQTEVVWFVAEDGTKFYIREEVKEVLDNLSNWYLQSVKVSELVKGNDKAIKATIECKNLFEVLERDDIAILSKKVIEAALQGF